MQLKLNEEDWSQRGEIFFVLGSPGKFFSQKRFLSQYRASPLGSRPHGSDGSTEFLPFPRDPKTFKRKDSVNVINGEALPLMVPPE